MSPLERRCRSLLRAYPRWYRRQRGDEMLATLLEASQPGQRWPSARDTRALIIGGLRVRGTQDQRLTTAANLRLAAQLGAALTLLLLIAGNLTSAILVWAHIYAQNIGNGLWSVYGLLGLATVVAAWFAPRLVVAVLAAATAAAAVWVFWGSGKALAILPAGLLIMLAVLVCLGERLPRSWLWLAGAWFGWQVLEAFTVLEVLRLLYVPLAVVPLIILGLVVLWAFVDARPAMAMAICIACTCVVYQLLSTISYGWAVVSPGPGLFIFVAAAVVLASGSFWRLHRQAVL
jgi:hypothetical protein